ncbi:MAG: cytochrome C, partial [Planctomycetes bacterium]|nr:cytochrome C [Planctomycetota bacterium]
MDNFIGILTKPDNIPIAGMLIAVFFFYWYGLRQAFKNDKIPEEKRKEPAPTDTWPYLVRIEFVALIVVSIILNIWSIVINA